MSLGTHPHQIKRRATIDTLERRVLLTATLNSVAPFIAYPLGSSPATQVVVNSQGDVIGTTARGGKYGEGTVFEITHGTSAVIDIFDFNGLNGAGPRGSLAVDAAGNIYGTAGSTAASTGGEIFRIDASTHAVTVASAFPSSITIGTSGLTIDASGNLYGVSSDEVFEYTTGGATQSLISLTSLNVSPTSIVSDASGDLFISVNRPSTNSGDAVLDELVKGQSSLKTIFAESSPSYIVGTLAIDASSNVYALSSSGSKVTTILKVSAGTNNSTIVTTLSTNAIGSDVDSLTVDTSGNLFGESTLTNGSGTRHIFELPSGGSAAVALSTLPANAGTSDGGSLALDSKGNLFGAGYSGDTTNIGTVFELRANSSTTITIGSFASPAGGLPVGQMVQDKSGDVFGVTDEGGLYEAGTVWELPAGTTNIVTLASMQPIIGQQEPASLSIDAAGNLFGTTHGHFNSISDNGGVFELAAGSSTVEVLATFKGGSSGSIPAGPVSIDSAGDLFLAAAGGSNNYGALFELPHGSSNFVTLASFSGTNGASPGGALVMDSAGDIFGTCRGGGASASGVLYELVTGSSQPTVLYSFSQSSTFGSSPTSGVAANSSGNIFGGTSLSATSLFEYVISTGTMQSIGKLANSPIGTALDAPPVFDSFGNLFAETSNGGSNYNGGVFEVTTGGATSAVTTYPSFTAYSGAVVSPLLVGRDDTIYVSAEYNGQAKVGELYDFTPESHAVFTQQPTVVTANTILGPKLIVAIKGPSGNVISPTSSTLTLTIQSGPAGGTLVGATGYDYGSDYEFPALALPIPGTYVLAASLNGVSVGYSAPITVPPTGSATGTITGYATGGDPDETVYLDANGNGVYDSNEYATIATEGANNEVGFSFKNVPTGSYVVRQVLSADAVQVRPFNNNGVAVTVSSGSSSSASFIDEPPSSVGSVVGHVTGAQPGERVYVDLDNTNVYGDQPFATVDSNGNYAINNVYSGTFIIRQILSGGYTQVTPAGNAGISVTIPAGGSVTAATFTDSPPQAATGSVSGTVSNAPSQTVVYLDADNSGTLNGSELSATTSATGAFSFSSVPAGSYVLRQVLPSGYIQNSPANNSGIAITISGGSVLTGENFTDAVVPTTGTVAGTVTGSTAGETVFLDANNNSTLDAGELSTTTSSTGAFSFASVPAGSYIVRQVLPTGYTQSSPTGNAGIAISVTAGSALTGENFTDAKTAIGGSVSGSVTGGLAGETIYLDANNNSKLDVGEFSTTTTATGTYSITGAPAGATIVRQVLPTGYTQTTPTGNTGIHVTITNGGSLTNENFADKPPATSGSVAGTVTGGPSGEVIYLDTNNNSVLDSGELSTATTSTGTYRFATVPAGSYVLRQVAASGYTQTTPASNAGIAITVTAGSALTGENFTDAKTVTTGSVAGTVTGGTSGEVIYLDANNNSVFDSGELSTTTTSTGTYSFASVPAGSYVLRQVLASGYVQKSPASNGGIAINVVGGSALTG